MIYSVDAGTRRFLDTLRTANSRLSQIQQQVASTKRLCVPSDDPASVSALMQAESDLSRLDQTNTNLARVTTEVDSAEMALQSAVKLMDQVRTLGMTGASTLTSAATRNDIANELGTIMERLAGLANTQVDGRYVFSGDNDQAPAFPFDLSQTPPWSPYAGLPATRRALHPTGITFVLSKDGGEIFDNADPAKSVFQTIETLRQALLSGDDAAMAAALEPLAGVSAHLNSELTFYGNVQSQLTEATDMTAKMKLRIETEQADLEDADITESVVQLQTLKFNQDAALKMRASLPRTSLFDFLG